MRILVAALLLLLATHANAAPLNAVIGDRGWVGVNPTAPDRERIAAHLTHVEGVLREASQPYPEPIRARRLEILDHLTRYRLDGAFPHNTYAADRVPVFVDADGRRCAVAALAEHDLGAAAIQRVASRFRLAEIGDIRDPGLTAWIAGSGFTVRELATIQPSYRPEQPSRPMTREQLETSAVTLGANLAQQICEAELVPGSEIPKHVMVIDLATAKITWEGQAPERWKTCVQKYVTRGLAKLGTRTVKVSGGTAFPWTKGTPPKLQLGKAVGYMQFRLEHTLAACRAAKRDEYDAYRIEIDLGTTGRVTASSMTNEMDTACIDKEIERWKFPGIIDKAEHLNLEAQPISVADRFAELDRWIANNLKIKR